MTILRIEPARNVNITVQLPGFLQEVKCFEVDDTGLHSYACLVKDGKAVEKNVVVGRRTVDWVVVEGVDANTPVVASPGNLVAGQPVTVGK